jgi:dihydropteridine reductase
MTSRVVVYGGRGALGTAIVTKFKESGWWVANVDMKASEEADENILVEGDSWAQQEENVVSRVSAAVNGEKLDAVICVAGGWAGGSPASKDFIKNSDLMWRSSVWPASISASLAAKYLREGGLVVLPGAAPAVAGTPGMAGYGMAKAAVHQLTQSLASPGSGLPDNSLAVAILPVTLDTPMNRKWMAKADQSAWTPLEFVSSLFLKWAVGDSRPKSGSLVKLVTEKGDTSLVFI